MGQKGAKNTSSIDETAAHYEEVLGKAGAVTTKKMFGGYGIFENGVMFGMVTSASKLCFKVDASNLAGYEEKGATKFGRMPYYSVPADVIEDQDRLLEWAGASITLAHKNKKK